MLARGQTAGRSSAADHDAPVLSEPRGLDASDLDAGARLKDRSLVDAGGEQDQSGRGEEIDRDRGGEREPAHVSHQHARGNDHRGEGQHKRVTCASFPSGLVLVAMLTRTNPAAATM